jgi:glycosyltransferase involved in cell wall biosynthesis
MLDDNYSLFVVAPWFDDRVDRFELFVDVLNRVGRGAILLKACDPVLLQEMRGRLGAGDATGIEVWGRRPALGFQRWAANTIRSRPGPVIVHDIYFGWATLPLKLSRWGRSKKSSTACLLSLYFPNPAFARALDWRGSSTAERFFYLRMLSKRLAMEYASSKAADYVIGNSPDVAKGAARYYGVPARRCVMIRNNVDTGHFSPRSGIPLEGIPPGPRLLYVGSLQKRKGIYDILDVAGLVKVEFPDVRLILVGKLLDFERDKFNRRVAELRLEGNIIIQGFRPREALPDYYSGADVCLVPSYFEGSPRVLLEALACGCPVVATDIPGARLVDPAGEFISFAPPGEAGVMAAQVLRLLRSGELRKAKAGLGLQRVRQRFSTQAVGQELFEFYRTCL